MQNSEENTNMKPAKTIALLQQKGGSGKTTTSLNIAGSLKEQGFKVAICDMDKDKPDAWSWAVKNDSMKNIAFQIDEKNARNQINELKQQYDYLIVDTPPNFQTAALKAALLADLVIIPTAPSGMDLSGLMEAKDLALTAGRPFKLLANRIVKNTTMSRSLLSVLDEEGQAFDVSISQSVKFVEAEAEGLYIGEYAPNSILHKQVKRLAKEIVFFFEHELEACTA
jgi:chromosome partitioning protein